MKKLFTLLLAMVFTANAFSQSPNKMSYQAVIRDSGNGLITNHSVGMRISILHGSATGTPIYVETQTPATNLNGLVTLEIGGGTPVTGTFTSIDWSTGTYFIKTETDPTGGTSYTITGTSQLLSVPYALYSKSSGKSADADNLGHELKDLKDYLYSQLPEPTNPIANWKFDGNLNDDAGTYSLTSSGSAYEQGKIGSAFKFTGSEECYNTDINLRRIFDSKKSWSVNLWFNSSIPYDTPTGFGDPSKALFTCDGDNISPFKRTWILADQRGILFSRMLGSGSGGSLQAYFNFVPDTWYHVSVNFSGSAATVYINGSEASFVLMGDLGQDIGNVDANTTQVTIGGNRQNNVAQWKGLIDQVYVYNRELTSAEVHRLYNDREFPKEEVVTDISGNTYNTLTIGTQTWMTENLNTTKYRTGDLIGTTTPSTLDISGESNPKYQWVYNGEGGSTFSAYGRLYTWYAVTDSRNVCPTGWHVPSDAEWTTLTTSLGGESVAGGKLKETGTTHWSSPNTGATNETGFTGLPGGNRDSNGSTGFYNIRNGGNWWSSTGFSSTFAYFRHMYFDNSNVLRGNYDKQAGFSVRCVKDN